MAESESGTPRASAPATPGTPTPLFSSLRVDSLSYDRKSMPRCKCLPLDAPTWGAPHTCLADFPAPDISLTRKVLLSLVSSLICFLLRKLHSIHVYCHSVCLFCHSHGLEFSLLIVIFLLSIILNSLLLLSCE